MTSPLPTHPLQTLPRMVLLVEDETTFRRVIARNLTGRGLQVMEAATVAEALAMLHTASPDLMLLDINLPDRTGWELLRELRRTGRTVPTVVVSAVQIPPARVQEFPQVRYLPKPFPIEAMLRIVFGSDEAGDDGSGEEG